MSRMESLIELCDLIAQNPAQLVEKLAWICGRCPPAEILLIGSARVSRSQLNAILAVARFLSKCPNHSDEMPKSLVLAFYRSIPSSLNPSFWPQSITNDSIGSFFRDFLEYVCKACELSSEFSADVARLTADILNLAIGRGNADWGISKAILKAMSYTCPPVVPSHANKLVSGLLEMIVPSSSEDLGSNEAMVGGSSGYNNGGGGNGPEKRAIASFKEEPVDTLEKRAMALELIGNILDKVSIDANLLENVRVVVKQQLQLMVAFLKIRKRDWSEQGQSLKVRINLMFAAQQAATRLQIKTLASLDLERKSSKKLLHEALALLMEVAEACLFSVWRKLRACEELFSTLLSGICHVAVVRDGQMLQLLLSWFKHLVLVTCAQADTWGSYQWAMFENVLKTSSEINQFGWDKDHSRLYTFITSLLERSHFDEEVEKEKQAAPSLLLNVLMLLADLNVSGKRPEVVDMVLPFFIDSLEEGDASLPGLLRLRLLDAVARMASLGFEKSYREAVVLMTKSYLSKLAAVGSAESKTTVPEAITERVETLPAGFLLIARDLTTPKLRTDYRHRLLSLCSDVGLASESKSGKSGADFLGPLLPAVAEICSDSDPTVDVEPSLLKLFRNLWFYVALFGLAPPLQNHHGMSKSVSTTLNSVCSLGSVALQAVSGPYMWSADWSSAVQRISQGTPPLVVSSMELLEDELELNALHNPGSPRGSGDEKAAVSQRIALSTALGGCIKVSAMSTISGVKSTYLLAVAILEITRFCSNGGILSVPSSTASRTAFSCVFEYLKSPGLEPAVSQCLTAIVQRAFGTAVAWLEDRMYETGPEAEYWESTLSTHATFLVKSLFQTDEHIQYISFNLLNQLRDRFPQILWNSACLDSLLFLEHNDPPSSVVNDPACFATIRSLFQRTVREWIIVSLSQAPCTSQGLLQEKLCKANTSQNLQLAAEIVSLLSEINIGSDKNDCRTRTKTANIPAVMAAAAAASGAKLNLTEAFNFEVLNTGMISATAKCNHAGGIAGIRMLYDSIGSLDLPALGPSDMVGNLQPKTEYFSDVLLTNFVQHLQKFVMYVERGGEVDKSSFRETCSLATAFLLSDLGSDSKSNVESFSQLLHLLCWCPSYILTPDAMETGVFIWTWLVSAAPQLCSLVLAELVDAWLWTVDTKRGVFASEVRCCGPVAKLRPHLVPGEPEAPPEKDPVEQIMAHRLWLGFFIDRFEVVRHDNVPQLLLFWRLLQGTTKLPWNFSSHPAATGTFFTLMLLGLKFCSCRSHGILQNLRAGLQLLEDRIYRASLGWFAHQPEWYDMNKNFALSEAQSVSMFVHHLLNEQLDTSQLYSERRGLENSLNDVKDQFHPVWGQMESYAVGREKVKQLLLFLCQHEAVRLDVWAQPVAKESTPCLKISSDNWVSLARTAFSVDPRLSLCLAARFPANNHLKAEVTQLVQSHILEIRHMPEALAYFVTPKAIDENSTLLEQLPHWAACSITQALEFLTQAYKGHPRVMAYVLRVLESYPPQTITFFIPQLVQALRYDDEKLVEGYLLRASQRSDIFAHILVWNLQGETCEPESGKGSAKHAAFLALLPLVRQRIIDGFNEKARDVLKREFDFFDKVTSISGALYPLHKEDRRAGIQRELEKIEMQGDDLYLPTAPNKIVKGIQIDSGIPLQSAAKVSIMITFNVADRDGDQNDIKPQACIFKVGEDCREDVLVVQVISLLKDIFGAVGLNLYLYPYGVLPTGPERGIIEVVPNSLSRSQMGDGGLYDIFQQKYGPVGSPGFEAARENFIKSSAGYAVASLLLQPKDRHNGNILIDSAGRLVHIDFGFILENCPGVNMRSESAHFKLSHEMTQLIDPSGDMKSETWYQFVSLCVKGYLAARCYMDGIINTILMVLDSRSPCFSRDNPIGNFRKRFHPEMSEREAANYMVRVCSDAYKWTTAGYGSIQYVQQDIEK